MNFVPFWVQPKPKQKKNQPSFKVLHKDGNSRHHWRISWIFQELLHSLRTMKPTFGLAFTFKWTLIKTLPKLNRCFVFCFFLFQINTAIKKHHDLSCGNYNVIKKKKFVYWNKPKGINNMQAPCSKKKKRKRKKQKEQRNNSLLDWWAILDVSYRKWHTPPWPR